MKKKFNILLMACLCFFQMNKSSATIVVINAQGSGASNEFVPNVATAVCGDTIKWMLVSGNHTTASTSVPSGANSWSETQITSSGFMYVVTIEGTYNYTCHISNGGHMSASIIVNCSTGINSVSKKNITTVFPNPFVNKITIETTNADVVILSNILGEKINSVLIKQGQTKVEMNTTELPSGVYFYSAFKEGILVDSRKIVKN